MYWDDTLEVVAGDGLCIESEMFETYVDKKCVLEYPLTESWTAMQRIGSTMECFDRMLWLLETKGRDWRAKLLGTGPFDLCFDCRDNGRGWIVKGQRKRRSDGIEA